MGETFEFWIRSAHHKGFSLFFEKKEKKKGQSTVCTSRDNYSISPPLLARQNLSLHTLQCVRVTLFRARGLTMTRRQRCERNRSRATTNSSIDQKLFISLCVLCIAPSDLLKPFVCFVFRFLNTAKTPNQNRIKRSRAVISEKET